MKYTNVNITKSNFTCKRGELTIRGLQYAPQGENLPIAIVSHGFMANLKTVEHYVKTLANMGYAAFCFDFCGGSVMMGKSDGKTTDMSVITETEDLTAVIEYAKSLPHTNSDNVLLMGCSQGGLVSALVAAKQKEKITKLVLFYPAFSIPDDAKAGKMMWAKFDPKAVPETLNCGPMKLGKRYVTDVLDMNPFDKIKSYCGEVLIVHGTKDKIVPLAYSEKAYITYLQNTPPEKVKLCVIENGAHMFSKKHDVQAISALTNFASLNIE